jgi:hypothetical protein
MCVTANCLALSCSPLVTITDPNINYMDERVIKTNTVLPEQIKTVSKRTTWEYSE